MAASLTMWMPAFSIVVSGTAVTLSGSFCLSSGSFWAVTVTVGISKRSGSSWGVPDDWVCGAVGVWAIDDVGDMIAASARQLATRNRGERRRARRAMSTRLV